MREKDFDLDTVLLTLAKGSDLEEISSALQPFTSCVLAVENSSRLWVFPSPEHLPSLTPVSSNGKGRVYRSADGKVLFLPSLADRRETYPLPSTDRKVLSWKGDGKLPFWPKQTPGANEPQKTEVERKIFEENKDCILPATACFSRPSQPQEKHHSVSAYERTFSPQAGKKESPESTWEIRNI